MSRKLCTLLALAALGGCRPAAKAPVHDTFTKMGGKADAAIASLVYGTTSRAVKTSGDYGWFQFAGNVGDSVEVWVRSSNGDAVAFLLDGNDDVVAANDDADGSTSDAHVTATLPADGTYYIAFREYSYAAATFTVELEGSGVLTCKVDADCVAVPKAGCCDNGWFDAVNAAQVDAYESLYACSDAAPVCSHVYVQDKRIAECSNTSRKCEMIDPSMIHCKGNVANAHQCPDGWTCSFGSNLPDIGGTCVPNAQ